MTSTTVFTVGHSNHSLERFMDLLHENRIEVLVDVRSSPYSRYATWFNADPLKDSLKTHGVRYLFLGDKVGGRPEDPAFYDDDGHVLYDRVAASPPFLEGIDRLMSVAADHRVAIMCGEEDPTHCHRNLLVGRVLQGRGVTVQHIRGDGRVQAADELGELTLFGDEGESQWRSTQSVSPRNPRRSSSDS